ncbi:hypothetical protein [Zavarzinia sp. CC-PAN008]|uniref:hypothetical protein n=1 Tax=Zavarzinia sp. CC-PAN008 TaxID=3243332 RepID=UPI003F743081
MNVILPTSFARRSPIHHKLAALGARWGQAGESAIVRDYGASEEEAAAAQRLALSDLSPLPRTGFKGPQALAWLRAQGVVLDEVPNTAWTQGPAASALILSWGEALILDANGDLVQRLEGAWSLDSVPGVYCVPRRDSHGWLRITGHLAPDMLAKICGVDLRPKAFAHGQVAQTSVARGNAIIARADLGDTLAYHLLSDSSALGFLWDSVIDAMTEYGAGPVGADALTTLATARDPA